MSPIRRNQTKLSNVMAETGAKRAPQRIASVLMLIVACQEHAADVVKRTISEARTKPRLNVEIRLEGNDFPTHDELALRQKLESEIERQHIGAVLDSGSGSGSMD